MANEPAFPISNVRVTEALDRDGLEKTAKGFAGLTKRELFAAMAMQGMLAHKQARDFTPKDLAEAAVDYTNALLAELNTNLQ